MANLPTAVKLSTVTGWFTQAVADSADAGQAPDMLPMLGTVTFTPNVERAKIPTALPQPMILFPRPIVCGLDDQGFLLGPDGTRDVMIAATGEIIPSYTVTFELEGIPRFSVVHPFPADSVIDLTTALEIPLEPSPEIDAWIEAASRAEAAAAVAQAIANEIILMSLVKSVNGQIADAEGDILLNADNIADTVFRMMMTDEQNIKLGSIEFGATANSTDEWLRDRDHHTGQQSAATIDNFAREVNSTVVSAIVPGDGITVEYNYETNVITIDTTGLDTEATRDAIAAALHGSDLIAVTVDDAGDTITISTTATANASDASLRARASHTGTQTLDTILETAVKKIMTSAERTKLTGIEAGATLNSPDSRLLNRGFHIGTQSADTITDGVANRLYLAAEKIKLAAIAAGATANASDAALRDRSLHTGSQLAATISDFAAALAAGLPGRLQTIAPYISDANLAMDTGSYSLEASVALNSPVPGSTLSLTAIRTQRGYVIQEASQLTLGSVWRREYNSDAATWGVWEIFYKKRGSFTPTFANFTLGNGTVNQSLVSVHGGLASVDLQITLGSTSVVSGDIQVDLPYPAVGAAGVVSFVGGGRLTDTSANLLVDLVPVRVSSARASFRFRSLGATAVLQASTSASLPFVFASGDIIYATLTYPTIG